MSMVYETEDGIFIEVADSWHPREPCTSHFLGDRQGLLRNTPGSHLKTDRIKYFVFL